MKNETLKEFFKANAYQLIAAVVAFCLTTVGAYVSFQLWEQNTNFQLAAQGQRLDTLEATTADISTVKVKVDMVIANQEKEDAKLDRINDYLLNHR